MENNLNLSNTEERILTLLGQGIAAENVAAALGITPARISQLLSNEEFSNKVTELRYQNLQRHNARDNAYDEAEDELVKKLKKAMPLMFRPETILKAIQVINGAKRRGQSAPEQIVNQNNIVNLTLPVQVTQKFVTNVNNQVIKAGEQELLTMPSGNLIHKLETMEAAKAERVAETKRLEEQKSTENDSANEDETFTANGVNFRL